MVLLLLLSFDIFIVLLSPLRVFSDFSPYHYIWENSYCYTVLQDCTVREGYSYGLWSETFYLSNVFKLKWEKLSLVEGWRYQNKMCPAAEEKVSKS